MITNNTPPHKHYKMTYADGLLMTTNGKGYYPAYLTIKLDEYDTLKIIEDLIGQIAEIRLDNRDVCELVMHGKLEEIFEDDNYS